MHGFRHALALFIALAEGRFIVPPPTGPHGVSLIDLELVDTGRRDPYTNASQRTIPISIISPAGPASQCVNITQPYMVDSVASFLEQSITGPDSLNASFTLNHTFTETNLSLCEPNAAPNHYPLILFSAGLGFPRQFYHIICSNIASWGYSVVTVETPGQSGMVVYADGTVQYADAIFAGAEDPTDQQLQASSIVRETDLTFALNSLSSPSFAKAHPKLHLNTSRTALFGHSFGGSATIFELMNHTRFYGGANLDGAYFGQPLTDYESKKPFLQFASSGHNQSSIPSWATVWQHFQGWKLQLQLENSGHWDFTDMAYLFETYGVDNIPGAEQEVAIVLGTIEGHKALKSVVGAMLSFFNFLFFHGSEADTPSVAQEVIQFADILVVNGTGV
ncbi:hypothetical protein LTR67_006493 [Exophiala xenobiotica]